MAGSYGVGSPSFSALYLFDHRTHGDDGNFVGLWRQCEKPDRWYAGGGEKPAQCGRITLVFTRMLLKTLAVLLHLVRILALGSGARSGGARRLTASTNG